MVEDYIGKQFGTLLVIGKVEHEKENYWKCRCVVCGLESERLKRNLVRIPSNKKPMRCNCNVSTAFKAFKGERSSRLSKGRINGVMPYSWVNGFEQGAHRRKIEWNLTYEFVYDLYEKQGRKCALTHKPLYFGKRVTDTNASIDRIDNDRGYTEDNVHLTTGDVNMARGRLPLPEFKSICHQVSMVFQQEEGYNNWKESANTVQAKVMFGNTNLLTPTPLILSYQNKTVKKPSWSKWLADFVMRKMAS